MNRIEWNDIYKTNLCIEHHIYECKRKFKRVVDTKAIMNITSLENYTKKGLDKAESIAYDEYMKELVDLYLLIESYLEQTEQNHLVDTRVIRFTEKSK